MAIDFNMCFNEYINSTDKNNTRIISDFNAENATRNDYRGREIYEMLQNAEDAGAEAKMNIDVVIDYSNDVISIANKGGKPFSDEGFTSIMRANQSSKIEEKLIGNKGLGFRAILNWAKEIEIHSRNIKCTFSEKIANEKWMEIQKEIEANIGKKETKLFVKDVYKNQKAKWPNAKCPIAILPLPKYEKTVKAKEYTTKITIKLQDDEEVVENIVEQLNSLDERVLLFLTWCKSITIIGDKTENRVITCDKSKWLFHRDNGNIGEKEYSIILAYPKNESKLRDSNPLHTFFPTKINIDLPIIVHATFELTMSRNGLIDNSINKKMQEYVAKSIIAFAEQELSTFYSIPSWDIYHAIDMNTTYDDIWTLRHILNSLKHDAKIFPTIDGTYEFLNNTYYYSEDFSEYVTKLKDKGWHELKQMLISGKPDSIKEKNKYNTNDLRLKVNALSGWIKTIEDRCELIKALKEIDTHIKFDLLYDQEKVLLLSISKENVYINTGQIPRKLPSDFGLKFVDEGLIQYLITHIPDLSSFDQENQKRNLSNYLNTVCNVTTSDITSIKNELKKYSKKISQETNQEIRNSRYKELLICIMENQELFSGAPTTNDSWMLLAKDGSFHPAYSLIIKPHKYFDRVEKFILDLSYFGIDLEDSDLYENLYYNVLNISKYIPIIDVNPCTDEEYLEYLANKYDSQITSYNCQRARNINHAQILSTEYLSNLNLTDLVIAIHKDSIIKKILEQVIKVYYLKYKCQYDDHKEPELNYAKYTLQKIFNCSRYVTSERTNFLGEIVDYDKISEYDIQPTEINYILLSLGAKDDYSYFSVDELYDILNLIYKNTQYKDGKGVQSIYKKIREALLIKMQMQNNVSWSVNDYKKNLYLYSKTHGEYFLCDELYYWDNDRLPKSILGKLPKLDIGSRIGEDSVKKLFFVKIPSTKEYLLEYNTVNDNLQKELDNWINDRLTFIYANSVRNVRSQETLKKYSNKLKSLKVIVCLECAFKHDGNDVVLKMENNEIIPLNGIYYLKSNYINITEANNDPQFWNSLTEIFCLTLNVSREDVYRTIRDILRSNIEFNKLDVDKYLSPEEWEKACREMGISETEYAFWRKIIGKENFNTKRFNSNKTEYIKEQINIDLSDIYNSDMVEFSNMTSEKKIELYKKLIDYDVNNELYNLYFKQVFVEKYKINMIELRNNSKNSYTKFLYEGYKGKHEEFLKTANEYMGQWIEKVIFENRYYSDCEIKNKFVEEIKDRFYFHWDGNNIVHFTSILPHYISILGGFNLSEDDLKNDKKMYSLCFFAGHDDELKNWINSKGYIEHDINKTNNLDNEFIVPVNINTNSIRLIENSSASTRIANYIGRSGKVVSDKVKSQIGKRSEILVYESMLHDSKYTDVIGISKNLDPVNGNDNAHYDITYKDSFDLDKLRYLEIKTATYEDGNYKFLMSAYEYEFAKEHIDCYDVALVIEHQIIKICKSIFKNKPTPTIYTYEVCININSD